MDASISYDQLRHALFRLIDAIDFLERIKNLHDCNDCGAKNKCEYMPRYGDYTRINCPLWEEKT